MSDLRIGSSPPAGSAPANSLSSLQGSDVSAKNTVDKGLLAQKPSAAQQKKWAEDLEKQKSANPTNLKNILGLNSEQAIKALNQIGISTEPGYLEPLDRIAAVTAYSSPASLGSNWEQKTAFLKLWARAATNDVAVSTQGIQVVNQLYQQKAITANEARLRVAGYTLKAQAASAKLNIVSAELGRAGLTAGSAESREALARLKTQAEQSQASIRPALKAASVNLDTINKTVQNQAAGVENTAVANVQQLENLRQRALDKSRAVSPEPRATSTDPKAPSLESDPKSGVALPNIPAAAGGLVSRSSTLDLIQTVLPITRNGKPAELRSSPTPGMGIGVPEVGKVATQEKQELQTTAFDLNNFANLSDQQFKAKFGDTRARVQRELDAIKQNKPVEIDTRGLQAPMQPASQKIDWKRELAEAKFYANTATDLSPKVKEFIKTMDEKTMAQYNYVMVLAGADATLKIGQNAAEIRALGRGTTSGETTSGGRPAFSGEKFGKAMQKLLPSADLTQLNNLFGQLARNKDFKETVRAYTIAAIGKTDQSGLESGQTELPPKRHSAGPGRCTEPDGGLYRADDLQGSANENERASNARDQPGYHQPAARAVAAIAEGSQDDWQHQRGHRTGQQPGCDAGGAHHGRDRPEQHVHVQS